MSVVRGASLSLKLKVNYRTYSWEELVVREWGTEWGRPDIAYEFSGGRTADCTDQYAQGIYAALGGNLLLDNIAAPDRFYGYMLQDNGGHVLTE